ncbi:MAG TPA: Na/Pi cotransporter family protein [bacterium]|nr:Na/Pi cotransporter family protein [bacterium]HPN30066.1 Na/Pi cotransporter family protein [bacterium]
MKKNEVSKILILVFSVLLFSSISICAQTEKSPNSPYKISNFSYNPGQDKISGFNSEELTSEISVQLTGEKNSPITNEPVYFKVLKHPDKAKDFKLSQSEVFTDSAGFAKTKITLGDKDGIYYILASSKLTSDNNIIIEAEAKSKSWWFYIIIGMLGGLAMFIYGLSMMGKSLTKLGGDKLSDVLKKLTSNKYMGILVGFVVTTIFQSSSATTVLIVGLINAGVMNLVQSIGIILGANIGATTTPQIVAFKLTDYAILLIGLGFLFIFLSKTNKKKYLGEIILGLGFLFYGLKIISDVMYPMRSYEPFIQFMQKLENPYLGVLVGTAFTALIQSSGAAIGVFISLAFQGILTFKAAIPLTFGANIGTCITAFLASIGSTREARRSAYAHILFNVITTAIFLPFLDLFQTIIEYTTAGGIHAVTSAEISANVPRQIANANTISKIFAVIITLPFTKHLAKLCVYLIPEKEGETYKVKYLDENALMLSSTALNLTKNEIARMAFKTKSMLDKTITVYETKNEKLKNDIIAEDDKIDFLEDSIKNYLSKISQTEIGLEESEKMRSFLYITEYIEHIADIINKEMMPLAQKIIDKDIPLYKDDFEKLKSFHNTTELLYKDLFESFAKDDYSIADDIIKRKTESIKIENEIKKDHYTNLCRSIPEVVGASSIYLDILNCYRNINSNLASIAYVLKGDF